MKKLFLSLCLLTSFLIVSAQTDTLQQYAGAYVFPDGSVVPSVEVKWDNGSLTMESAAGNSSLTQVGIESFSIVEFSVIAVFKRGDDKKINGVYIDAAGYILEGKKQFNGIFLSREFFLPANRELWLVKK